MVKKRLIKEKALFLLYLTITLTFFTGFSPNVSAQSSSQGNKACCEVTKNGDSCVYTDKNECDANFKSSNTKCEQTSYCTNLCCADETGSCFINTPRGICERQGSKVFNDASCLSISQCNTGCCMLGDQFIFTSEGRCAKIADGVFGPNNYNIGEVFKRTSSESECLDLSLAEKEGCCVDNNACSYGKKSNCNGAFKLNTKCSDVTECKDCKPDFRKGCKDGNVYTFDSCGNSEDLIEACDYSKGRLCREDGNNAACESLDCSSTTKYEKWNYTGGPKKHGESWCIYESPTGDFTDRPGSRQYRFSCLNKEEISEGCRDFRQEICLQGKDLEGFGVASCIRNDIYDSEVTSKVSTVATGFKFWENNDDNAEQCSAGTQTCVVTYVKKNRFSDYVCRGNCQCEFPVYIDQANQLCKSKGDCGFSYNIEEKEGSGGLSVLWAGSTKLGSNPISLSEEYKNSLKQHGIYGGMAGLNSLFSDYLKKFGTYKDDILGTGIDINKFTTYALVSATLLGGFGTGAVSLILSGTYSLLSAGSEAAAGVLTGGATTGPGVIIAAIAAIVIIVVTAVVQVVLGGGNIRRKTVTINCQPWKAPVGGSDCSKCISDPKKECSEYRCKSLGTSCTLINEGTEKVECVDSNPFDVSSPKIEPLEFKGYTISKTSLGYKINEEVEAFKLTTFGVKTDEAATCKYDFNNSIKYEDMKFELGDSFYKSVHNLSLVLAGSKEYKYFVKCEDIKGNKNSADYLINFRTKKAPDLTAPVIVGTSVKNGAVLPYDLNVFLLELELNELADCRYDVTDKPFNLLNNLTLCDNEISDVPKNYGCSVPITGIKKGTNNYYFRCRDLANNTNTQPFVFSLIRSDKLGVKVTDPASGSLVYVNDITLNVETSGGAENGKSICRFNEKNINFENMPEFKNTDSNRHLQSLINLRKGNYNYFVKCRDSALNEAETKINFRIALEGKGNEITYVYKDSSNLYLVLNVASSCEYSDKIFSFGTGIKMGGDGTTVHTASLNLNEYNIKCVDDTGKEVKGVTVNV
ncbi:hypothetical protein HYX16_01160 [Candidatus Woesearchaeota archaeon]|nr:hypothetical protein [Candidatus Woesearchaeota archaeon]